MGTTGLHKQSLNKSSGQYNVSTSNRFELFNDLAENLLLRGDFNSGLCHTIQRANNTRQQEKIVRESHTGSDVEDNVTI